MNKNSIIFVTFLGLISMSVFFVVLKNNNNIKSIPSVSITVQKTRVPDAVVMLSILKKIADSSYRIVTATISSGVPSLCTPPRSSNFLEVTSVDGKGNALHTCYINLDKSIDSIQLNPEAYKKLNITPPATPIPLPTLPPQDEELSIALPHFKETAFILLIFNNIEIDKIKITP